MSRDAALHRRFARGLGLLAVLTLPSACATVIKGSGGQVRFQSEPPGAEVLVDGQPLGTTPTESFVRHGPHRVEFRKEGYHPRTDALSASFSGHTLWLFPYSTLIDILAGNVFTLDQTSISARLDPVSAQGVAAAPLASGAPAPAPAPAAGSAPAPPAAGSAPAPRAEWSPGPAAASGAGIVAAVFDVEDPARVLDAATSAQLADYLGTRLSELGGYRVVPRRELQTQLRGSKQESLGGCYDEQCQIELGKAVAAQKILTSKVLRVGKSCALSGSIFDLRTESTDRSAAVRTSCSVDALLDASDQLLEKLLR
jgi:hypothetical protein